MSAAAPPPLPRPPWDRVRPLLEQAMALAPARREALLAAPGLDAALVAEVRSLLAHGDLAATAATVGTATAEGGFLAVPARLPAEAAGGREGERLGPWRLTGRLGSGGMGEVWRAERADGAFTGQAAIKLLRRGFDSAAVLGRFAQEQQALARLVHPHIARLMDAGRSADGQPYFVMELVEGRPIDRACAGLPVVARLALFLQLADAVAHAHRHLLVHRDLKPGNVLVDSAGQVKLLDFGIAKALQPEPGAPAVPGAGIPGEGVAAPDLTQAGTRPYTPHYASPEQVRGEPVSTATDIYSLGVLLYVMLTGVRPYGREANTPHEAARSVLEDAPTRPSALSPAQVADPQWLATRARLRGDLDHILLKALDKHIGQRYASVDALAADVRAHLAGFPVAARAQRPGYLLARFVQRHRAASALAALALLSLVGGLGATAWQAQRAEQQRQAAERRFEQVRVLAKRLLFDYHDEIQLLPGSTALRQRMLQDAQAHLQSLSEAAAGQPALQRELGVAWRRLGEIQHAESRPALGDVQASLRHLATARGLLEQALAAEPEEPETRVQLALVLKAQARSERSAGQPAAALPLLQRTAALFDALAAAAPQDKRLRIEQVRAQLELAEVHGGAGGGELADAAQARRHLQAAVALVGPLLRDLPDDADALALSTTTLNLQWLGEFGAGRVAEGLAILKQIEPVFVRLQALAPDNTLFRRDAAVNLLSQGTALRALQRWPEALAASSEALRRMQALAAADPANRIARRDVAKLETDVATAAWRLGRADTAAAALDRAVAALEGLAAADAADGRVARLLALAHAQAAEVQASRGDAAGTARHAARAVAVAQAQGARAPHDSGSTQLLASVQTQTGQAWRALPPSAPREGAACRDLRAAAALWAELERAGRLRVAEQGLRDAAGAGAAACGPA